MHCTLRFSNSGARRENSMNSVVQTGVKSAGCENSSTHLPALVNCESVISPWVLITLKSGAGSLMRGIGCLSCASIKEPPLSQSRDLYNRAMEAASYIAARQGQGKRVFRVETTPLAYLC